MSKTETIRARIEPRLKAETEAIFTQLGLSSSQAISLFYKQVILNGGLPFEVKLPNNAVAFKTLGEPLDEDNLNHYENLDDLKNEF